MVDRIPGKSTGVSIYSEDHVRKLLNRKIARRGLGAGVLALGLYGAKSLVDAATAPTPQAIASSVEDAQQALQLQQKRLEEQTQQIAKLQADTIAFSRIFLPNIGVQQLTERGRVIPGTDVEVIGIYGEPWGGVDRAEIFATEEEARRAVEERQIFANWVGKKTEAFWAIPGGLPVKADYFITGDREKGIQAYKDAQGVIFLNDAYNQARPSHTGPAFWTVPEGGAVTLQSNSHRVWIRDVTRNGVEDIVIRVPGKPRRNVYGYIAGFQADGQQDTNRNAPIIVTEHPDSGLILQTYLPGKKVRPGIPYGDLKDTLGRWGDSHTFGETEGAEGGSGLLIWAVNLNNRIMGIWEQNQGRYLNPTQNLQVTYVNF